MGKNLYIVADGLGGAGKDSVLVGLREKFLALGYRVVMTYEPGGTIGADILREQLFARKAAGKITPVEELEYVFAARALNMTEVVLPSLASVEPTVVLKARDYLSSFIYQIASGASRDLLLEFFRRDYEQLAFPKPDLRLLLLLSPEEAMRRRLAAGLGGDGFDAQAFSYWRDVSAGYYSEATDIIRGRGLFRRETAVVMADQPIQVVTERAWRLVANRFNLEVEAEEGRPKAWKK